MQQIGQYLKKYSNLTIAELGVWKGQTTWLIKKILPKLNKIFFNFRNCSLG